MAALLLVGLLGCWSVEPYLPADFPRDRLLSRLVLPVPNQAVHLRWYLLSLPQDSKDVLEQFWREVDEQVLAAELRPLLRANGLRVGVLTGKVPTLLRGSLAQSPKPPQVLSLLLPPRQGHFQAMGEQHAYLACPTYYAGECSIAEFAEAQMGLYLEVMAAEASSVHLSVTPAVRHRHTAPAKWLWAEQSSWPLATGQTETRLAFLSATVQLTWNDWLVVSASPSAGPNLGTYLFTDPVAQQTRLLLVRRAHTTDKPPSSDYNSLFPNPGTYSTPGQDSPAS